MTWMKTVSLVFFNTTQVPHFRWCITHRYSQHRRNLLVAVWSRGEVLRDTRDRRDKKNTHVSGFECITCSQCEIRRISCTYHGNMLTCMFSIWGLPLNVLHVHSASILSSLALCADIRLHVCWSPPGHCVWPMELSGVNAPELYNHVWVLTCRTCSQFMVSHGVIDVCHRIHAINSKEFSGVEKHQKQELRQ
jgi:hypothetical protein